MSDVRYSICATHLNNNDYIRDSAGVFADLIVDRENWELVVTDAGSNDGSLEYLQTLAHEQENVRIIIEKGINRGEGRQLASEEAVGDILIQVMDLDAVYFRDDRLLKTTDFYEKLLKDEGDVMLSAGLNFCTKKLLQELGGWSDLIANEETELKRRALRLDRLRFCPIEMFVGNAGSDKSFIPSIRRFYYNSTGKIQSGVSLRHMILYWLRHAPGIKPRVGALIVFPFSWITAIQSETENRKSYRPKDKYIMGFKRSAYENRPDIWLEPPEPLQKYVDSNEVTSTLIS